MCLSSFLSLITVIGVSFYLLRGRMREEQMTIHLH